MNTFRDNPFFILDANTRDDSAALTGKADDLSFLGEDGADDALGRLLQPQQRLKAELSWFPGRVPAGILEYIRADGPVPFPELRGGDALGRFNALGACLLDYEMDDAATISAAVKCLDEFWQEVTPDAVLNDINADREAAGIDPVTDRESFAEAFREQRAAVVNAVAARAGTAHARELGEAVIELSDNHTQGRNPDILGDLADCYARLNAQQLQELSAAVRENAKRLRATEKCAPASPAREICAPMRDQLKKWGAAFLPILRANAARAVPNTEALEIYRTVRSAITDAYNNNRRGHDIEDECIFLSCALREIFSSERKCVAQMDEDVAWFKKSKEFKQAAEARKAFINERLQTLHWGVVRQQLKRWYYPLYSLCPVCQGDGFVHANVMDIEIESDGRVLVKGRPGCESCGGTGVLKQPLF